MNGSRVEPPEAPRDSVARAAGVKQWLRPLGGLLLVIALGVCNPGGLAAAAEESIDTERAFRSLRGASWYDQENKQYAPPQVETERDSEIRRHGWVARVKPAKADPAGKRSWNWNWLSGLSGTWSQFLSWIVLIVLGILLAVGLIALLIYSLKEYLPGDRQPSRKKGGVKIDPTRVEELPFDVRAPDGDPLSEAQRLMRAGRYDEAIIYLYAYLLLGLDQARKVHLQKGKTNRMYLRELQRTQGMRMRKILESTMLGFEQVFFGRHSLSREHFESLWGQLDEFHELLAPPPQAADWRKTAEVASP